MKIKKLFIKTHGCQMNEYDSKKMVDVLSDSHQFELTQTAEDADLILLNTCSIREKAQEKVFSQLGQWRKIKNKRPELVIGVGGCVASQEGAAILKRAPYVGLIFGPQTLHRLPELYNKALQNKPAIDISFPEIEKFDHLPKPRAEGPTAFVSIMEGCSKYCTYCIVPYTRGQELSRPLDSILSEIMQLAEQGVREITLLGQNVNDYLGEMHGETSTKADLALLIQYIASIDQIKRIRFTTSHPSAFSDSLIQAYAEVPKLVNHLHLPVQSGSDKILTAMKRGYSVLEFKSKMKKLRKIRPDIKISSDFIVGFPGETEEDFQATMNLVQEIGMDHSYSFIFSPRPGTPAASLIDETSLDIKKQRLQRLQARIAGQANDISHALLNTIQPILVTNVSKKREEELSGRTECNRVVNFKADKNTIGQIIDVKITEVRPNSLRGEVIESA